ncbi:MAG TPA: FAD-dependent oxidoreductase [Elainellaceae cyanobacterium]
MSRTILTNLLQNAYRITQISTKYNISTDDAQGRLADQISRRKFLQGSLALTAGLGIQAIAPSIPPVSRFQTMETDSKVLIVGAGIAGLIAAYRLHQAGVPVDIVEATSRIGGRMRSFKTANTHRDRAIAVELGGEFIDSGHVRLRSLVRELGLDIIDLQQSDEGLIAQTWFFDGQMLSIDQILEGFKPLVRQMKSDLSRLGTQNVTYHAPNPMAIQLDQTSLAEYLDRLDIDSTFKNLIHVTYLNEFGREPDEQSSLNLLHLLQTNLDTWSVYGTSDERFNIVGGNEQIPRRLAETLAPYIKTGTILESINRQSDGRYRVGLQTGLSSVERTYERILLAIPFSVLRDVAIAADLPPVKQHAIQQLGYGTHTKLLTPFREPIWRTQYHSTATTFSDLDFQSIWESSRYASTGWLANLTGGFHGLALGTGSSEYHAQRLVTQVEHLYPGIGQVRDGRAIRAFWPGEHYQRGSYSCYLTGQWTQFGGAEIERVGNIWFAGEHCSYDAQGYMEGACETGEAAATGILQDLGVPSI